VSTKTITFKTLIQAPRNNIASKVNIQIFRHMYALGVTLTTMSQVYSFFTAVPISTLTVDVNIFSAWSPSLLSIPSNRVCTV